MGVLSAFLSTHGLVRFTLGHWPCQVSEIVPCGRSRSWWTVRPLRKDLCLQFETIDGSTDIRRTQVYPHTCSWPQAICELSGQACTCAIKVF